MTLIDDPEHLRVRAADLRARADRALFPETKQGLLRIAEDYEVLAKRAEQRIAWWAAKTKPEHTLAVEPPPMQPVSSEDRIGFEKETEDQSARASTEAQPDASQ